MTQETIETEPKRNPVDDLAGLWPEVSWPFANVLCEGPSILAFDPADLLKGPIIAVNRAIALRTAQAHFWATTDDPRHLWAWSEPYRPRGLRYFTTDQNLGVWQELLQEDITRVYSTEMTEMGLDDDIGRPMTLPTLMPLLAWLLRLGIKRVRLFGVDMLGVGASIDGPGYEPWEEKPDRKWDSRWLVERVLLSHVIRAYRAKGARCERWEPARRSRSLRALSA